MKIKHDSSTKQYYRCLSCSRFRNTCGGIPTRGMDLHTWCEYMRDVMEVKSLTCAYVAKEAEVSLKTVERIHAVNIEQDIMRSTARQIELVVIGSVANHICDIDYEESKALEKVALLQAENAALREDVAFWRKENDRKAKIIDKYLD